MKKLWYFILHNLDTILAIILSVVAAGFGVFGGNQAVLLSAIAGTLGLLAYGIIRDRFSREKLLVEVSKIGNILNSLQEKPSADTFFTTKTSASKLISQASEEVCLIQETGSKVIEENFKSLEALIKNGGKVKLVLSSDNRNIADLIAFRNKNLRPSDVALRQKDAVRKLISLADATKSSSGCLEVKQLRYPLDITAVFIDPEASDSTQRNALIRMVGFQNFYDDKRDFLLSFSTEPQAYQYFYQQFLAMWNLADVLNIPSGDT